MIEMLLTDRINYVENPPHSNSLPPGERELHFLSLEGRGIR
jgi:hypothetical protein